MLVQGVVHGCAFCLLLGDRSAPLINVIHLNRYVSCIYSTGCAFQFIQGLALANPLSFIMLFLLFVYYLLQGASIDAAPMPSLDPSSLDANHCSDLTHCRTIWNIVWSCIITIFSCTWVAIHPNIPCPKVREANSRIQRWVWNPLLSFAEHRLPLFVCALLVPEYVLAWAIRQYMVAREIAKKYTGEFENSG